MVKTISSKIKKICGRFCKQADNNREAKGIKFGFSLVEVLVSMLVVSVFFLATTKVLTQKHKVEFQKNPHGYYECFKVGNSIYAHRVDGGNATDYYKTTACFLSPPKGINFINIHYVEPGANKDTPGKYYNIQEPIFNLDFGPYSAPNAFMQDLEAVGIDASNSSLAENDKLAKWNEDKKSFFKYLELSHPDSEIIKQWGSATKQPPMALFLAW